MFAIVETGGNQYRVEKGNVIEVEKLDAEVGTKVTLDNVLMIHNEDDSTVIGNPVVKGAKVEAEVVETFKDKKVIIFKKRRRQNSRRKNGHRQTKTRIKILNIVA